VGKGRSEGERSVLRILKRPQLNAASKDGFHRRCAINRYSNIKICGLVVGQGPLVL
jgi:hypothetical protein